MVEEQISKIDRKIEDIETILETYSASGQSWDEHRRGKVGAFYVYSLDQLIEKKRQLREKKRQLRENENLLLAEKAFRAGGVAIHPRSPQKIDAVFILCVYNGEVLERRGTAFAVSSTKAITSNHNLDKNFSSILLTYSLNLSENDDQIMEESVQLNDAIRVCRTSFDVKDDWAVLEIIDQPKEFAKYITICLQLPEPSSTSPLTIFHPPPGLTVDNVLSEIKIWKHSTFLLQYQKGNTEAIFDFGKVRGCCGSPYVLSSGEVLAFHTESFNGYKPNISMLAESKVISNPSFSNLTTAAVKTMSTPKASTSEVQDLMERIDSISEISGSTHSSYSRGIVVASLPDLLKAIK